MAYKSSDYDYSFDAVYISDNGIALEETNNGFSVYCMNNGAEELLCKVPCPESERDNFVQLFQERVDEVEFTAEDKKAIRLSATEVADKIMDDYETKNENHSENTEHYKISEIKEFLNAAAITFSEEFTFYESKEPDDGAELRAKWEAIKAEIEQRLDNINEYIGQTGDVESAKNASNEGAMLSGELSSIAGNIAAIDTSSTVEERISNAISDINSALQDFKADVQQILSATTENDNTRIIVYTVDELSHNIQADLEYIREEDIERTAEVEEDEAENEDVLVLTRYNDD